MLARRGSILFPSNNGLLWLLASCSGTSIVQFHEKQISYAKDTILTFFFFAPKTSFSFSLKKLKCVCAFCSVCVGTHVCTWHVSREEDIRNLILYHSPPSSLETLTESRARWVAISPRVSPVFLHSPPPALGFSVGVGT